MLTFSAVLIFKTKFTNLLKLRIMENDINTITLETAQTWAAKWRLDSPLKAFWIPKDDIDQMYQHDGTVDLRAYLGIDENGEPKLMIVGVDENGNDLIDEKVEHYIYDFTKPCPNMCDVNSPLYNLR